MSTDNMFENNIGVSIREYQDFTPTTMVVPGYIKVDYLERGLAAEIGELLGHAAKYYRGDFDLAEANIRIRKELGDIMYFISEYCNYKGWDLRAILAENMEKLKDRQRRGTIQGDGDDR